MKNRMTLLPAILLGMASTNVRAAEQAAWMLCNACSSTNSFAHVAKQAPDNIEHVFVSNMNQNITRRFEKKTIIDDLWDGIVTSSYVIEKPMSSSNKAAFEEVIENANRGSVDIPRPALPGYPSLISDISGGRIDPGLFRGVTDWLDERNFLGEAPEISGVQIPFTPILDADRGVRTKPLNACIEYESGAAICFQMDKDLRDIDRITVTDDEGNPIDLKDSNDSGSFFRTYEGQQWQFSDSSGLSGIERLVQSLNDLPPNYCITAFNIRADGTVVVTCSRP